MRSAMRAASKLPGMMPLHLHDYDIMIIDQYHVCSNYACGAKIGLPHALHRLYKILEGITLAKILIFGM